MKKSAIIALLVLLVGAAVMLGAGYRLFETNQTYQEANSVYDDLSSQIRRPTTAPAAPPPVPPVQAETDDAVESEPVEEAAPQIYIADFEINFESLSAINDDVAAWLYSPNTVIDYPVMKASDYNYYLKHLVDGTVNANGSLFIDYNNSSNFSDELTVIYGHHMKSGAMFGSLKGYKEQSYFDEHPFMYLYTKEGNYRIDLIYGIVVAAGEWRNKAFMYQENLASLLSYARENTTFRSDVEYQEGDRVVALSTCSYEFNDARYVVIGVLRA